MNICPCSSQQGIRVPLLLIPGVVLALLVALAGQASAQGRQGRQGLTADSETYTQQVVAATNQVRTGQGAVALRGDACLHRVAYNRAKALASRGELVHQDLRWLSRECNFAAVGENLAAGFANGQAVVRDGWMRSPSHRENVLRPIFRYTGVASVRGKNGAWYVVQVLAAIRN